MNVYLPIGSKDIKKDRDVSHLIFDLAGPMVDNYRLVVLTKNKLIKKKFRSNESMLTRHLGKERHINGMSAIFENDRVLSIFIHERLGDQMFIRVLAHEASHLVDYLIDRLAIKSVDTEVRAYLLDYIVGRVLSLTKFENVVR